jgi:hypothetical protein
LDGVKPHPIPTEPRHAAIRTQQVRLARHAQNVAQTAPIAKGKVGRQGPSSGAVQEPAADYRDAASWEDVTSGHQEVVDRRGTAFEGDLERADPFQGIERVLRRRNVEDLCCAA